MNFFNHVKRVGLAITLIALFVFPAAAQLPQHIKVNANLGGSTVELNLSKYSVRSADFRVQSWSSSGGYVVENHPSRQYRGYVTQDPNRLVVAFINTDNTLDATVHNGSGQLYSVSDINVSGLLGGGPAPALPTTGIPILNPPAAVGSGDQAPPGPNMPPVNTYTAHGVYDISSQYYLGSVAATLAYEEYKWNLHDFFNMRDAKLRILLTEVIVRKEQFYTPTTGNAGQFTGMLRTEWAAQGVNRRGFIASLFPENYTYAGGYASGNDFYDAGNEPVCVQALFHENAHNWGAQHWYYGQDTMSGSHPAHGAMNVMRVLSNRAREITEATPSNGVELTTNAVTLVHPQAFPDLASTLVNTSVDIAPLANDWDANGEALSIKYFTSNTAKGGTVTKSGNVLTYTPATGYVGKDIVVYEVQDTTGHYTVEVIHIEVINQGLAASWAFEETSGTTATDGSGNGHPGTLSGTTFGASSISGPVGNALALAGEAYMVCDTSDLITEPEVAYPLEDLASNFFDPMDESFTATCWFRLDPAGGEATLFSKRNPGFFGYIVTASSSGLSTTVRGWNGIGSSSTVTSGALQPNLWYHMAMVINRSDHSLRLYLNGAEVGTAATLASDEFIFNGREDLVLGGGASAVDLDEAQIHTKALSLAEIQALHNAGDVPVGGPQPTSGAVNQSVNNLTMSWVPGHSGYLNNVYFGTNAAAVAAATPASPEYQGQQAGITFNPGALNLGATYFWRIDEVNGGTTIPGPVWSFSTAYSELLSDLVLHLTMDNDDVQSANGGLHTFDDVAAPAQDFEVIGGVVPGVSGIIGQAVDLTAAGQDDTLRSYAVNPVAKPLTGGMTISFWMNTTSTQNGAEKVYDFGGAWFMYYYNGDLMPVFDGSSTGATTFDTNINDGQWHHIVVHNDGAGTTTLFVDGAPVGSQSEGLYDLAPLYRTVALGSKYNSTTENLDASFDDFAVWQRALSNSEVAGIHTSGLSGQSFSNEPVLVNTSFEAAEGFTGFGSGTSALGTVTDNDGVIWTELTDTDIWNSSFIPPDGQQALVLGLDSSTPGFTVEFPGTTHGVGLVTFDYASFTSYANTDFSLSYNDNAGSGWVEVWSKRVSGSNPDWTEKPWSTVEVAVNIPGDVDLRFAASGSKGPMIDNMRITGRPTVTNLPPVFAANPFSAPNATEGIAYSATIADSATDPDAGDTLTYSKQNGPEWLVVAADGTLSGLPLPTEGDLGVNTFTVRATDQIGLWADATLEITVDDGARTVLWRRDWKSASGTLNNSSFDGGPVSGVEVGNQDFTVVSGPVQAWNDGVGGKGLISTSTTGLFESTVEITDVQYAAGTQHILEFVIGTGSGPNRTGDWFVEFGTISGGVFTALPAVDAGAASYGLAATLDADENLHDNVNPSAFFGYNVGGRVQQLVADATDVVNGQNIAIRFGVTSSSEYAGFSDMALSSITVAPMPPVFLSDPVIKPNATEAATYNATLAGSAADPNPGDTLTYSKQSGPAWLSVAPNGALSGTPPFGTAGSNTFTVRVTDQSSLFDEATLEIEVDSIVGALFSDDFERTDGTTIANGWIEQTGDSRIYDTGKAATKMVIHASSATTPFAIVNPLGATYVDGGRYELTWNAAKATSASGTLNYSVSLGTWNGAVFTPLSTESGSLTGLNDSSKKAGPNVYRTAAPADAGQPIAVRFEVLAGSGSWAGFDDVAVNLLGLVSSPDVSLGGPAGTGYDITMSWIGELGVAYGVQTNANLVDGTWGTYLSGLMGDGGAITFTNDIDEAGMFFRIIVE